MPDVQQVPVGGLYGLPGFTERFEQYENLNGIATTNALSNQTPFNPPASFQKTDIVFWWELEMLANWSVTYSAGTLNISPEAPYNLFQNLKLKLQGQYTPLEVESGFDAAFMQMYRPMRGRSQRAIQDLMQTNPVAAANFANSLIPQANLAAATLSQTTTSPYSVTNYPFNLEIPAGIYLDEYWDLAIDGTLLPNANGVVAPHAAFVSPQYMGGGERVIAPQFNFAAIVAPNYDSGPLAASAALTVTASSGSATLSARRVGVFASENPAELPPVYNWQYRRSSKRFPINQQTKFDVPITEYGQLLSTYIRIFDPTLGTNNVGGYYNVANVNKAQLLYGSNLPRFDDDIPTMQKRFVEQHGFLPPQGTIAWDLAASRSTDQITNATALNTLTNANTHYHVELASAPGAGTYAVVGTELLVPVAVQ